MGVVYGLTAAIIYACANTLMASQASRVDSLSISVIRICSGLLFFAAAVFVLGIQDDIGRMGAWEIGQIMLAGFLGVALGETLYVASVSALGMTRAFTTILALYNLNAYLLSVIFLGESVRWQVAIGSVLVLLGVYLVALYGRGDRRALNIGAWVRQRSLRHRPPIAGESGAAAGTDAAPPKARPVPEIRLPILGRIKPGLGVGGILALATGLVWAIAAVWFRSVGKDVDAAAVAALRLPLSVLLLSAAAWAQPETALRRRAITRRSWAILLLSGLIGIGVGSIFFFTALQELGAGRTVVLFSTSPLWALPLGAIFLREEITVWVAVGTVIAVGGIVLLA